MTQCRRIPAAKATPGQCENVGLESKKKGFSLSQIADPNCCRPRAAEVEKKTRCQVLFCAARAARSSAGAFLSRHVHRQARSSAGALLTRRVPQPTTKCPGRISPLSAIADKAGCVAGHQCRIAQRRCRPKPFALLEGAATPGMSARVRPPLTKSRADVWHLCCDMSGEGAA